MFRKGRKIGIALTVALCMVIVYSMSMISAIYAKTTTNEAIDTGAYVSLTLKYPVNGAKFSIYKSVFRHYIVRNNVPGECAVPRFAPSPPPRRERTMKYDLNL